MPIKHDGDEDRNIFGRQLTVVTQDRGRLYMYIVGTGVCLF